MVKILALVVLSASFLAYGESPVQVTELRELVNPYALISEKISSDYSGQQRVYDSSDSNLKSELYNLIQRNNESLDLLAANQEKLAKDISDVKSSSRVDYSTWTSILLACVGIIITILSVILAIISIIGYRNFKKSIELNVKNISTAVAKDETTIQIDAVAKKELARLIDEGALTKHLESAVDMIVRRNMSAQVSRGFDKYPELDKEDNDQ
ncbi:hypothetical protein ACUNDQ_14490 [Pectobacterium brasiliense]|uniref:hypothetical protein n=1 Tax=Pectobacterium brasiliense TaxID=180957 RepID=UPI004044B830